MADLITLQEYKAYEGIKSDTDDPKLLALIESVSQLVKSYCSISFVDFVTVDKVESFSIPFETSELFLTESPLISVSQVQYRNTPTEAYQILDAGLYDANTYTDSVMRFNSGGTAVNWPIGPNAVIVTYRAGWTETPADLKLAVMDLVNYYKNNEHKPRQSIGTANRDNPEESRQNPQFPPHIKRVLDLYKIYT